MEITIQDNSNSVTCVMTIDDIYKFEWTEIDKFLHDNTPGYERYIIPC